jgi:hypothetical protein
MTGAGSRHTDSTTQPPARWRMRPARGQHETAQDWGKRRVALTMVPSTQYLGLRMLGLHAALGLLLGPLVAFAALLGSASGARAQTDCTAAFEKWSKLSTARLRMQNVEDAAGTPRREPCMLSQDVRVELQQALARARSICEQAPWLDQYAKQTKEMIDINANFIGSVPLCRQETAARVETEPTPPRAPPRARACLEVAQVNPERFVLSNRKCSGATVLAVIEKRGPTGKIDCKAYTIDRRMAVATLKDARPQINYECVLEQGKCTKAHVATIFPECDW